jgi:hypothetical protein
MVATIVASAALMRHSLPTCASSDVVSDTT